ITQLGEAARRRAAFFLPSAIMKPSFSLAAILFCCGPLLAQERTLVLIPVFYNGPGAFGTEWHTGIVINNHSQDSLSSPGVTFAIICPIPEGCTSDRVPSGQFGSIIEPSAPNGLLLTLPGDGRDIAFT